jgi:hypothetical protein
VSSDSFAHSKSSFSGLTASLISTSSAPQSSSAGIATTTIGLSSVSATAHRFRRVVISILNYRQRHDSMGHLFPLRCPAGPEQVPLYSELTIVIPDWWLCVRMRV